ncbi:DUF4148 domain-containing protein [Trinickia sp. LjRoot230]|uniref:DUF4148 domain-containing protein n=1 Tax=Trinickia sp. LjRoot230 TaxID=3342288 RepID=UPI003ECF9475
MKSFIKPIAIAVALGAPVVAFAQSNQQPLTRAEVRADLERVMKAGYNPADWMHYPQNIQAAEARVAAEDAAQGTAQAAALQTDANGVGGVQGNTESGRRTERAASAYSPPVYQHN